MMKEKVKYRARSTETVQSAVDVVNGQCRCRGAGVDEVEHP